MYKYVQSHIIVLHQFVSVTRVTISREDCIKNTTNKKLLYKNLWFTHSYNIYKCAFFGLSHK